MELISNAILFILGSIELVYTKFLKYKYYDEIHSSKCQGASAK